MTDITLDRAIKLAFRPERLREAEAWRTARKKDPAIARLVWKRVQQARGVALSAVVSDWMENGTPGSRGLGL